MKTRSSLSFFGVLLMLLAACAPQAPAATPADRPAIDPAAARAAKTLTVALETEPDSLGYRLGTTSNTAGGNLSLGAHQTLATYDERGEIHPMLASDLPSQAAGTWIVNSDGTMVTTYRLRPNVTWHDGTPMTAKDVAFGWTISNDVDLSPGHVVARQISRIETPDDLTVVIHWPRTYPYANAVVEEDLSPLPRHILEQTYLSDHALVAFVPYWTTEFIGVGPFRLEHWERGSYMILKAYDGFYGAPAKIGTIIVRFMANPPTVVANMMAGTLDGVIPRAIDFDDVMFVKGEWERAGLVPVSVVQITHWRIMTVQFRVPFRQELLDPRFRRALLHGVDRQSLADTLLAGQTSMSHTFLAPDDVRYEWVKDVITQYAYDPRRSEQLLGEVGWRRSADGFVDSTGARMAVPITTTSSAQNEREQSIIADGWRSMGLAVDQRILGKLESDDRAIRAAFPAVEASAMPMNQQNWVSLLYGSQCPTEANRWAGRNRGCYQNPEWDRLIDRAGSAVDPADQRDIYRTLARIQSEELPVLPLYYNVEATLFRQGVTGIRGNTKPKSSMMWNVAEWDIR